MGDEKKVMDGIRRAGKYGRYLDHGTARTIASWYQSPGNKAITALSTTGNLTLSIPHELEVEMRDEDDFQDLVMLRELYHYCAERLRVGLDSWDDVVADGAENERWSDNWATESDLNGWGTVGYYIKWGLS